MSRDAQVRLVSCGKLDAAKGGPSRATVRGYGPRDYKARKACDGQSTVLGYWYSSARTNRDSAGSHDPSVRVKPSSELRLAVTRPVPAYGHPPGAAASDVRQTQR